MNRPGVLLFLIMLRLGLGVSPGWAQKNILYESKILKIEEISEGVWMHTSYLEVPRFGPFPCNGMVWVEGQEAIVFDTPTTDSASLDLIRFLQEKKQLRIKGVVVTHFHVDCLGGLAMFHTHRIRSYASLTTRKWAKKREKALPRQGFSKKFALSLGGHQVINRFFGAGHTRDNIVCYLPHKQALFGGCLIKEVGAGKGNLADARVKAWAKTVRKIKESYPAVKHVIPGHGKPGGVELLDYTIEKFTPK